MKITINCESVDEAVDFLENIEPSTEGEFREVPDGNIIYFSWGEIEK